MFFPFAICAVLTYCDATNAQGTYLAAVVEYFPIFNPKLSTYERLNQNADKYVEILGNITKPLDIIVFPESTLHHGSTWKNREGFISRSTLVPAIEDNISPCEEAASNFYDDFFVKLSCAAKRYKTYLSVNLLEKSVCNSSEDERDCAEDNWNVFNTNVVFDRQGFVVSRYRKFHLFGEHGVNTTAKPEAISFKTDFGVTFGVFICFDIMFPNPSNELLKQGVKHFIYPSMWFSQLPFLVSTQTHQMWSYENDIVLLASGANNPKEAGGGSGIYQGRNNPLQTYFSAQEGNKVLLQHVPKIWAQCASTQCGQEYKVTLPEGPNMDGFNFWKDDLQNYTSEIFDANKSDYKLCSNNKEFCCDFNISAKFDKSASGNFYHYRLVAYSGLKKCYENIFIGIEICALIACTDENLSSCGERFLSNNNTTYPTLFENISISAPMSKAKQSKHYPNALTTNFDLLDVKDFSWNQKNVNGDLKSVNYLLKAQRDLYTFGIYGRYVGDDTKTLNLAQKSLFHLKKYK